MTDIVQFDTSTGPILIEVEASPPTGVQRVSRGGSMVTEASKTLEEALAAIRPATEVLLNIFRDGPGAPKAISLEFSMKFSASLDVVIAKSSGEGNIKVTLNWER